MIGFTFPWTLLMYIIGGVLGLGLGSGSAAAEIASG